MSNLVVNENKTLYLNDTNINIDINSSCDCIIYAYYVNKDVVINANLNEEGSKFELHLSFINDIDNKVLINVCHNKDNTESNIYNHGINRENKKLVFDVSGKVFKKSNNCICNQENIIINLKNGESIINPNLLIDNFDISSSHSAYIGKFKDDELFYLMSRGITHKSATKLLMQSLLLNGGSKEEDIVKDFLKEV